MTNQAVADRIQNLRTKLLETVHKTLEDLCEKTTKAELLELGAVKESLLWSDDIEKVLLAYTVDRKRLRNCFKLIEFNTRENLRKKEKECKDKIALFLSQVEESISRDVHSVRFQAGDVADVQKMAQVIVVPKSPQPGDMPRSHSRSMLKHPPKSNPDSSANNLSNFIGKVTNPLNDKPTDRDRSPHSRFSNNFTLSGNMANFASVQKLTPFRNESNPNNFLNDPVFDQSRQKMPLGKQDTSLAEQLRQMPFGSAKDPMRRKSEATGFGDKPDVLSNTKTIDPNDISKITTVFQEDEDNLLASGLFDNGQLHKILENEHSKSPSKMRQFLKGHGLPSSGLLGDKGSGNPRSSLAKTPVKKAKDNSKSRNDSNENKSLCIENRTTLSNNKLTSFRKSRTPNKEDKHRQSDLRKREFFNREPFLSIFSSLSHDSLRELVLRNMGLNDDSLTEITSKIKNKANLKFIDFSGNSITDFGVAKLCEVLPTTGVVVLRLSDNHITNEGLKSCFKMVKDPHNKVTDLSIDPCQIEKDLEGRRQIMDAFRKRGVDLKF